MKELDKGLRYLTKCIKRTKAILEDKEIERLDVISKYIQIERNKYPKEFTNTTNYRTYVNVFKNTLYKFIVETPLADTLPVGECTRKTINSDLQGVHIVPFEIFTWVDKADADMVLCVNRLKVCIGYLEKQIVNLGNSKQMGEHLWVSTELESLADIPSKMQDKFRSLQEHVEEEMVAMDLLRRKRDVKEYKGLVYGGKRIETMYSKDEEVKEVLGEYYREILLDYINLENYLCEQIERKESRK